MLKLFVGAAVDWDGLLVRPECDIWRAKAIATCADAAGVTAVIGGELLRLARGMLLILPLVREEDFKLVLLELRERFPLLVPPLRFWYDPDDSLLRLAVEPLWRFEADRLVPVLDLARS